MAKRISESFDPKKVSLSVVVPAYNSEQWIKNTLESAWSAIQKVEWRSTEIILVDDGSTDGTVRAAHEAKIDSSLKVIRQKNSGRLKARENGIKKARGNLILLLDSRIDTNQDAFVYVVDQIKKTPKALVWNGHILVDRVGNPFARFWYTITFLAWRRYMRHPRLVHYGEAEYDYYPKGTTGFLAPRHILLEAYEQFRTAYRDTKYSNDDTSLIRYIAGQTDIYMSPEYSFTYISRSTLGAFIPHTLHRGIVFIDGHFHRGSRYFYACLVYLILVPVFIGLVIFNPLWVLIILPLVLLLFIFAKTLGAEVADAAALAYMMPIFALCYTAGMYKGLVMKILRI
jgi:glycosyltransferase involved in cell wall biosynthesis